MKNKRNITTGIIISIVFLILFNISSFAIGCNEIRSDVIRLHVIANSDSESDQELKLKVRDSVLQVGAAIFDGSVTAENAEKKIRPQLDAIQKTAEETIKNNGYSYSVKVTLCNEYFETRTYNATVKLPAGKYLALKIIIGEGKGKNWWCVMFPTLCLPAVKGNEYEEIHQVFSENEENIVLNNEKFTVKFKIVEYIEKIKNYVDNRAF